MQSAAYPWNSRKSFEFELENLFEFLFCNLSLFADTEDASETDLAKHDEDDYVEIKEQ